MSGRLRTRALPCPACRRRAWLALLLLVLGALVAVPVATQPSGSGRGVQVPSRASVAPQPAPQVPAQASPQMPSAGPAVAGAGAAAAAAASAPAITVTLPGSDAITLPPLQLPGGVTVTPPPVGLPAVPGRTVSVPLGRAPPAPDRAGAGPAVPAGAAAQPALPADAATPAAPPQRSIPVLEFAPASLPAARVGQRYGPLPLVRHDGAAVVFDVDGDIAPSGLNVGSDGVLGGLAERAGRYRFTLTLVGVPGVSAPLRQTFTLRVLPPAGAAAPPAPAMPPPVQVPREVLAALPDLREERVVRSWKLGAADLERLGAAAVEAAVQQEAEAQRAAGYEPLPGAEPSAAAVAAGERTRKQLEAALAGLLEVEYATASQFSAALAQQGRQACLRLVRAATSALGRDPLPADLAACDAPAAGAATRPAPPADPASALLTPQQARAELLPPALQQSATALAARRHALADAQPVRWQSTGCGCVLAQSESLVYGLLPFWHAGTEARPLQVDFSAYHRIGYLGAMLADDGSVLRAPGWDDEHPDGLVRALAHGSALDVVVYRSEWAPLLALQGQAREAALRRTVQELMDMVQRPLTAWWRPWVRRALPFWPQSQHLYSGVTLHFSELPATEAARRYVADLVEALVPRLEAAQRGLTLQVVVRGDTLMRDDGIAMAVRLMELTESIRPAGEAGTGYGARREHVPRVPTRLLVLLDEPTTDTKKALRAALDGSGKLQSHQRVDFLNALLPMMAHPAGDAPARMPQAQAFQFDADLAYYGWQFGGAGLWPVVDNGRGAGAQVVALVQENFRDNERLWAERWTLTHEVCTWVCPHRTGWRLLLHGLLALGGLSLALFAFSCRVRALGRPMVVWMWGGLATTGLVFWLLLTCDPALYELSESNLPLVGLFAAVLLGALWALLQRRVPAP